MQLKFKIKKAAIWAAFGGLVAGLLWFATTQLRNVPQADRDRLWKAYRDK